MLHLPPLKHLIFTALLGLLAIAPAQASEKLNAPRGHS